MSTNNHQVVDYDSVLDAKFGKMGSLERVKHEEEARAFYAAQILLQARKEAKLTQSELAKRVGTTKSYISKIENGVITGSGFDVNPKSLGYSTCTYIGLNLERGSMYKNVVARLTSIPEIVECHFTTGSYTMLIKLYAKDNEQLMDLLNNKLQTIPGVVSTETLISLEQSIKREILVDPEEK